MKKFEANGGSTTTESKKGSKRGGGKAAAAASKSKSKKKASSEEEEEESEQILQQNQRVATPSFALVLIQKSKIFSKFAHKQHLLKKKKTKKRAKNKYSHFADCIYTMYLLNFEYKERKYVCYIYNSGSRKNLVSPFYLS